MEAFYVAVRLRAFLARRPVRGVLKLGVLVEMASELASVVGQHGFDFCLVRYAGWDHVAFHQVDGGYKRF